MNNIYKVIWSKAKNCYVVASEIARSHTKSASGSEKIGGGTRRKLLASLMALSLLCGGLGVASAANGTVDVEDIKATTTSQKVYTADKVDALLADYGRKDEVENNKNNIATLQTKTTEQGEQIAINKTNIATNTANITTLQSELANKANESDVVTALGGKANTNLDNLSDTGKLVIKATMSEDMDVKANKADVYSKIEANATFATQAELNAKANVTALDGKANTDLSNLTDDGKTKIKETMSADMAKKADKTYVDTALAGKADKADLDAATGRIGNNETNIAKLQEKTKEISHADGDGTRISGVTIKDGNIIGNNNSTITGLTNVETGRINGKNLANTAVATEKEVNDEKTAREEKDNELDGKITTLDGKVTTGINELKAKDTQLEGKIQTNAANIQKNKDDIAATDKRTGGITRNNAESETKIEGNVTVDNLGNVTAQGKLKGEVVDAGAVNAGSLIVENASTLKGNVTMNQKLSVTGDTTLGKTDVGGALGVTGATTLSGELTAEKDAIFEKDVTVEGTTNLQNTTVTGNLNVTGTITTDKMIFGDKPTNYTEIDKGHITSKNAAVASDATQQSSSMEFDRTKLEVAVADKNSNGHLTMTADKTSIKNSDLTEKNYSEIVADKDSVTTTVKDEKDNTTSTKSSATEIRNYAKDKDGNKTINVQTATQNKSWAKDKDGNESSIVQTGKDITNTAEKGTITNTAQTIVNNATGDMTNTVGGNQTNTIGGNQTTTVTGDISNTAKSITNEATDTLTDKVGTNTRVTTSTSITDTVGTKTNRKIEDGKITDTAGDFTVTTDEANGTTFAKTGGSTAYSTDAGAPTDTNIAGNLITTGRVDANELGVSDKDGDNTANLTVEAGEGKGVKASAGNGTTTGSLDVTAKEVGSSVKDDASGKGSTFKQRIDAIMGNVKTADGESEVTQKGNEITSKVGLGEASNSRVTQKKDLLEAAVTDGTNYNISNDTANASAKVLTDGTKVNKLQDNLYSSEKTITNGTYTTSKVQTALDITNTASDGTITNDAKNIVNNATGDMTNTVGGKLTTTVTGQATENFKGGLKTDITGEEIHTVTGNQTNKVTGKQTNTVEGGQENIISGGQINNITGDQTTTISGTQTTTATDINRNASSSMIDNVDNAYGTNTETKVAGKTTTDVSIKGTVEKGQYIRGANESRDYLIKGTLKNSETKTAEATSTEITDGNGKTSSTIQDAKNLAGSVNNGTETGVSGIHANDDGSVSIDSIVTDGSTSSVINQKKDSIQSAVGDGNSSTVIRQDKDNVTIASSNGTVAIGGKDIINNAQDTITNTAGTKITDTAGDSTVTTENGKGTTFSKTGSTAYREGGPTDTNISGNTITTGKVTMDYAEVMKDLGVRGNANIAGKTTTGELEVTGKSTLKGDVTMESNATVKKDLTVEGTTTTKTLKVTENATVGGTLDVAKKATFQDAVDIAKDLSVGGNATIKGDVTAKSYKVGDKTYISADGINANDQKITNVADGSISEGSKDAVNGGQLYGMKRDLEHQVDKVGANAAAMANLHPMEFDPDSKWNIAAAMGNYGSETAAALGAFYRPNDDVMVNLSTAFGTGENMVGGGVSVRLGKGGNKLSREESNALKAQVADLTARMDALLSVLNPNMSKDFPDVPENHWAYEAVSRLAGNDIVQGYPDGEFHGERTMTRYEMAEIIYNALSRGAEAEKELVEEFKPELQAMAASEKATAEKAEG